MEGPRRGLRDKTPPAPDDARPRAGRCIRTVACRPGAKVAGDETASSIAESTVRRTTAARMSMSRRKFWLKAGIFALNMSPRLSSIQCECKAAPRIDPGAMERTDHLDECRCSSNLI